MDAHTFLHLSQNKNVRTDARTDKGKFKCPSLLEWRHKIHMYSDVFLTHAIDI